MKREEKNLIPKPAKLGKALRSSVSAAWDNLGLVVLSSFIWAVLVLVPFSFGWDLQRRRPDFYPWPIVAGLIAGIILSSLILPGVFRIARKAAFHEQPELRDIALGAKDLFVSGLALTFANIIAVGVLATDAAFFFGFFGPLKGSGVFYILGMVVCYFLLTWVMVSMYHFPALLAQKPLEQKEGAAAAIKKSVLLFLGCPAYTLALFLVILSFTAICVLSVISFFLLFAGTTAFMLTYSLRELFIRYGVIEDTPEAADDLGWRLEQ